MKLFWKVFSTTMADILFPASNSTVVPAGAAKLTIFSRGTTTTATLLQRTFNERTIKYYYFKSRAETCLPLLVVLSTKPFAISSREALALLHDTSSLQLVTRNCIRFFHQPKKVCSAATIATTRSLRCSVCAKLTCYTIRGFFSLKAMCCWPTLSSFLT